MTGITKWNDIGDDMFCKSQLITCNRVKECNGVCPFEDALKHADKTQAMNDQHTVDHDRDWIIGCIEHDGFIKTDRFDKANQIILDALSAEAETKCVAQIKVDTEEIVRRIKEEYDIMGGWIPCSERLPRTGDDLLVTFSDGEVDIVISARPKAWVKYEEANNLIFPVAWMPLPEPYRKESEVGE